MYVCKSVESVTFVCFCNDSFSMRHIATSMYGLGLQMRSLHLGLKLLVSTWDMRSRSWSWDAWLLSWALSFWSWSWDMRSWSWNVWFWSWSFWVLFLVLRHEILVLKCVVLVLKLLGLGVGLETCDLRLLYIAGIYTVKLIINWVTQLCYIFGRCEFLASALNILFILNHFHDYTLTYAVVLNPLQ